MTSRSVSKSGDGAECPRKSTSKGSDLLPGTRHHDRLPFSLSKQTGRESGPRKAEQFLWRPRGAAGRSDVSWAQRNLTTIVPPWAMRSDGSAVPQITIHRKCKDLLTHILNAIGDFSGHDPAKIKAAHLDEFDGSYNFRMNVNSPSGLSLHAYGAAIDLAAAENPNGAPWQDNGRMLPRWAIDVSLRKAGVGAAISPEHRTRCIFKRRSIATPMRRMISNSRHRYRAPARR